MVRADSHKVLRASWYSRTGKEPTPFVYRTVTVCGGPFQGPSPRVRLVTPRPILNSVLPALRRQLSIGSRTTELNRFRLFPVRSPLLRESISFSVPRGTEMFHFPHCASHQPMCSAGSVPILSGRVAPFGNLRLGLFDSSPELFVDVLRPSSALDAKASTVRFHPLDLLQI